MTYWYIDTLDPRAGIAFASQRRPDLFSSIRLEDVPTAFVSPPYFGPEFVGARSTALAFARGPAQLGLLLEGKEEVPFDSIEAVAEFVRRTYLRGSGGNGPGEDGVPPLPGGPDTEGPGLGEFEPSPWPEPDHEGPPDAAPSDPVVGLAALVRELKSLEKRIDIGFSRETADMRSYIFARRPEPQLVAEGLLRAALLLIAELGRARNAFPTGEAAVRWQQSMQRLVSLFARVGLLPILNPHWPPWARDWLWEPSWRWSRYVLPSASLDPYEDLCHIPVPHRLVASDGALRGSPSLRALLQSVLATPVERLTDPRVAGARAELVVLAACHLNAGSILPPLDSTVDLTDDFLAGLAHKAQTWIAANLPQRVFSPPVEELIVGADRVRA